VSYVFSRSICLIAATIAAFSATGCAPDLDDASQESSHTLLSDASTADSLDVTLPEEVDGKLIILSDEGRLVVAEASPDAFTSIAEADILDGKCWTVPVLTNARLYARHAAGDLVCVNLRPPTQPRN